MFFSCIALAKVSKEAGRCCPRPMQTGWKPLLKIKQKWFLLVTDPRFKMNVYQLWNSRSYLTCCAASLRGSHPPPGFSWTFCCPGRGQRGGFLQKLHFLDPWLERSEFYSQVLTFNKGVFLLLIQRSLCLQSWWKVFLSNLVCFGGGGKFHWKLLVFSQKRDKDLCFMM